MIVVTAQLQPCGKLRSLGCNHRSPTE
jgi:hypothetical protein